MDKEAWGRKELDMTERHTHTEYRESVLLWFDFVDPFFAGKEECFSI